MRDLNTKIKRHVFKMLRARLYEYELQKREEEKSKRTQYKN